MKLTDLYKILDKIFVEGILESLDSTAVRDIKIDKILQ